METQHVTQETMARLDRGDLAPHEILAAMRHLSVCTECSRLRTPAAEGARAIADALASREPDQHLDVESELIPYIDGSLDAVDRELVESHLEECNLCTLEVDDLRRTAAVSPRARRQRRVAFLAVAIAAGILTAIYIFRTPADNPRPTEPTPSAPAIVQTAPNAEPAVTTSTPPRVLKEPWRTVVTSAIESGRLPFPAYIASLRGSREVLRGDADAVPDRFAPAGAVLRSTRPRFSWPARENATYVVVVYRGEEEVLRSASLTVTRWTPTKPLRRGDIYTWEVEVARAVDREIMPAPPLPPARFRIASATEIRELDSARRSYPDEHLLHAVLAARAGLRDEALQSLARVKSDDPAVARLLAGYRDELRH